MLKEKNIIVTGGAGLIGSAICKTIGKLGGNVAIADLDKKKSGELQKQLVELEVNSICLEMDITDKKSINLNLEIAHNKLGPIHGLVNNAYPRPKGFGKDFFDVEYITLCQSLNLHLGGYFLTSQCFLEYSLKNKIQSSLINMGSIYGVIAPKFDIYEGTGMFNGPEYAMIKSGVIHLTKYMAQKFKTSGIRVNSVCPGGIFDHQDEKFVSAYNKHCGTKGMLSPEDISSSISFLLSDESRYVTGQNLVIDDGFTL